MKDSLSVGTTHEEKYDIDTDRTIAFMGDDLRVYATPNMVRDVENTCRNLLMPHYDDGEDSVGAHVKIDHLGATLLGQVVTISAKVVDVEGPRVTFEVECHDELDQVGKALHVRFVIDKAKQGERLMKKKARLSK